MMNDEAMTNDKTQAQLYHPCLAFLCSSSFVISSAGNMLVYAQTECLSS